MISMGKAGGRRLDWAGVAQSHPSGKGFIWLQRHSGLDEVTCEALLADETRPRAVSMNQGLLVMLRGVNTNPGADPDDMVSIRLWIKEHRVISTRKRRLLSIADLCEAIEHNRGPTSPGDLIVDLADRMVARMAAVVEHIEEEIDPLEDAVVAAEKGQLRYELATVWRQIIGLRRYLAPQREAMGRLLQERGPWLTDMDRSRLREVSDRVIRYLEDLEAARDRAAVVQEEQANRLSEQMNSRMYVLSLVAAVFLPMGFLTGLLGGMWEVFRERRIPRVSRLSPSR